MELPVHLAVSELVRHPVSVPTNLGREKTLFRREMPHGGAQSGGFKIDAKFENLSRIGGRERHDEGAAARTDGDEALEFQALKRLPERDVAQPELRGEEMLLEPVTRLQLAVQDGLAVMCDGSLASPVGRPAIRATVAGRSDCVFRFTGFACRRSFIETFPCEALLRMVPTDRRPPHQYRSVPSELALISRSRHP